MINFSIIYRLLIAAGSATFCKTYVYAARDVFELNLNPLTYLLKDKRLCTDPRNVDVAAAECGAISHEGTCPLMRLVCSL